MRNWIASSGALFFLFQPAMLHAQETPVQEDLIESSSDNDSNGMENMEGEESAPNPEADKNEESISQAGSKFFRFGGKLGPLMATLGGEDADDEEADSVYKLGVAIGGFVNVDLNEWLGLQPELWFVRKGTGIESGGMEVASLNLSYMELPVLARITGPWRAKHVEPYVLLGPEVGVLLSATFNSSSGDTLDVKDRTKTLDIGLLIGGGAMIPLPWNDALLVEVRYDLGLPSIDDSGNNTDIKNRTLSIMLGYQYRGLCLSSCPRVGQQATTRP